MNQHRHELSDAQWQRIEHLFPKNHQRGGQWKDHRHVLDGILWIQATGAPWRDLPERFDPWPTVYGRFRRWCRDGFWQRLLEYLQVQYQADGRLDWQLFFIDGTIVRAHKAAAGARRKKLRGEPADHALGRSQGGFSTKVHLVCDGHGLPLAVEVGPGQEHETQHVMTLLDAVAVPQAGRPAKRRPAKLVGDKGYSAGWVRRWLRQHHITPVIAHRCNEAGAAAPFDRDAYRQRNLIERCVGWLKERRRLATRYAKLALHYLGMLHLGMSLRFLDSSNTA